MEILNPEKRGAEGILKKGMVSSFEPGVYRVSRVALTEQGSSILHRSGRWDKVAVFPYGNFISFKKRS